MPSSLLLASMLAVPVEWTAPAGCPDAGVAQRLVDAELAGLTEDERAGLSVEGTVLSGAAGHRLEVVLRRPDATIARVVALDGCSMAAEALALVVAIAIDPSRGTGGELEALEPAVPPADDVPAVEAGTAMAQPEPEPAQAEPAAEPTGITPTPPARVAPPRRRATRAAVRLTGGVGLGVLPRLGAQVGGEVAAVWRRARVGVQVEHWARRSVRLDDVPTAGGDLSLTTARVAGGMILPWRRLELPFVAFAGLGAIRARGVGVSAATERSVPWVELGAATGVQWFVRPWLGLGAHAELVVPLFRHRFVVSDTRLVVRTGPVAGVFRAGIELRFP